jgi:hypothetical protein
MPDDVELPDSLRALAKAVVAYVARHPDARDTSEGIAEWWIRHQRFRYAASDVARVLTFLVARGLLLKDRGPDGREHYEVNPAKREEIARCGEA